MEKRICGRARRRGVSIVECLILMVVLGVTLGAIFTTMAWSARSYTVSRQDMASRELFFDWVQSFESLWRNKNADVDDTAKTIAELMNGTWDSAQKRARIGMFTVAAKENGRSNGIMKLEISILGDNGKKTLIKMERNYNLYSNETVSDDVV